MTKEIRFKQGYEPESVMCDDQTESDYLVCVQSGKSHMYIPELDRTVMISTIASVGALHVQHSPEYQRILDEQKLRSLPPAEQDRIREERYRQACERAGQTSVKIENTGPQQIARIGMQKINLKNQINDN
jgi:hypothetical protein